MAAAHPVCHAQDRDCVWAMLLLCSTRSEVRDQPEGEVYGIYSEADVTASEAARVWARWAATLSRW
jgi:hypothetical protein